jgi:hypothetical protein
VHVVGLEFVAATVLLGGTWVAPRVEVTAGRVTFDRCRIRSVAGAALRVDHATVHLQDCEVLGPLNLLRATHGLDASASVVTVVGGVFEGNGLPTPPAPAHAIRLAGCDFVGSAFVADGAFGSGSHAVLASGGSTWIADATLVDDGESCALAATGALRVARTTFASGACASASSPVLGVLRPQPLRIGAPFQLDFRTEPNGYVAAFASPALAVNAAPSFAPPIHLDGTSLLIGGLAFASPTGAVSLSWSVPANAALLGQAFWFQGVTGTSALMLVSPVAGGVVGQ